MSDPLPEAARPGPERPAEANAAAERSRGRGRLLALTLLPRVLLVFVLVAWVSSVGGAARWLLLFVPLIAWETYNSVRHPLGEDKLPPRRYREPGAHRVVLQVPGPRPVAVIREVRRTTGAGLVRANDLVRSAPVVLVDGISAESADRVTECLRGAGARVVAAPVEEGA